MSESGRSFILSTIVLFPLLFQSSLTDKTLITSFSNCGLILCKFPAPISEITLSIPLKNTPIHCTVSNVGVSLPHVIPSVGFK